MGVENNTLRFTRFHRTIIHVPICDASRGHEMMDQLGHTLFLAIIELMSIEPKRSMTNSLKPDVFMRTVLFLLRSSENPLLKELVHVTCILALFYAVFKFHSVRSPVILRLEMCISEEQSDQRFSLEIGELQRRFPLFDFS